MASTTGKDVVGAVVGAAEFVKQIIDQMIDEHYPRQGAKKETDDFIAFFNDWEARDKAARAYNTYDKRFSFAGKIHGKWYACRKS
jgi:hypothetical protein